MPRYFFHVDNGTTTLDSEGAELDDLETAEREAVLTCGEMLREVPLAILQDHPWRLWVTDQPNKLGGTLLFNLTVSLVQGVLH